MGAIPFFTDKPLVDARNGLTAVLQVCQPPDGLPVSGETPEEECFGRGVDGVVAEIVDLDLPAQQPVYFASGDPYDLSQPYVTSAGAAAFFGMPPGTHRVRLSLTTERAWPPGAKLECSAERNADGWALGWADPETPNEFEFTVEPGWSIHMVRAYCRVLS